jgi:hypothetical protein
MDQTVRQQAIDGIMNDWHLCPPFRDYLLVTAGYRPRYFTGTDRCICCSLAQQQEDQIKRCGKHV